MRCACEHSFKANITVSASWCGALKPTTTMVCNFVGGLDCTGKDGCKNCTAGFIFLHMGVALTGGARLRGKILDFRGLGGSGQPGNPSKKLGSEAPHLF